MKKLYKKNRLLALLAIAKSFTTAIKVNESKLGKVNKKKINDKNQNYLGKAICNLSKIKCYNFNKKDNYACNYIKALKN